MEIRVNFIKFCYAYAICIGLISISTIQCGKEEDEGVKYANKCEGISLVLLYV